MVLIAREYTIFVELYIVGRISGRRDDGGHEDWGGIGDEVTIGHDGMTATAVQSKVSGNTVSGCVSEFKGTTAVAGRRPVIEKESLGGIVVRRKDNQNRQALV